jgi:endogenous inhibitor of DNA gyrase (YacG/DUF329 family)
MNCTTCGTETKNHVMSIPFCSEHYPTVETQDEIRAFMEKYILKGERRRVIEQIRHEEREHIKQTILIKLMPYLTDEQREKLVEVLKSV